MKKTALVFLAAMTLLVANSVPALAHGHGGHFRVGVGIGVGPIWPAYPYPYYAPYYYSPAPAVVREVPQEYIQQEPQQAPEESNYWYYCPDSKGYYPYVKRCPGGWMKVVPSPAPPEER